MKRFTVVVTDTGDEVWTGEAQHALDACERAALAGNPGVGTFFPYSPTPGTDFDSRHLVLSVYDSEARRPDDPEADYSSFLGAYAARCLD